MPTYRDYHFAHPAEKAAFEQLQSLDDGHIHLWPSVEGAGLAETDLFLIDDAIGAFVIELKAHPITSVHQINADCMWVGNDKQQRSAIKQAQTQLHALKNYVSANNGEFPLTVATVLWTNISRREWQQTWANNKQALELGNGMLFREDIDSGPTHFRRQLLTIYEKPAIRMGYKAATVSDNTIQRLIGLLGNKSAERSDASDRQMLEKFERHYRSIAQKRAPLDSVSRITLLGVPGTGKTWQLLSIAKFHAEQGKNVLFLCYNHVLRTNIEQMVGTFRKGKGYGRITVHTVFDHIQLINETGNLGCSIIGDDFDQFPNDVIQRMIEQDYMWEAYDTLLLDEAQDLKEYVGHLMQAITHETTNIVIGVGIGQDLYQDKAPEWLNAFMTESDVCELEQVYRTTAQTFQAAQIVCEAFTSNEEIEVVAKRVLTGKCHGMHEAVRPLRNIGRPPAIRRYKVETRLRNEDADIHTAGIQTQVQAIIAELEAPEKYSDLLFLLPTRKSPSYTALRSALENLEVPYIDFTDKANRDTVARDHQVRISTFHSCRGVEASIVVLMDLERLTERKNARQQLYIGLTRAVRLAIVLEPDIAVSQLATLLERAAACINAASTNQDFQEYIPVRKVPVAPSSMDTQTAAAPEPVPAESDTAPPTASDANDADIIHIPDTADDVDADTAQKAQPASASSDEATESDIIDIPDTFDDDNANLEPTDENKKPVDNPVPQPKQDNALQDQASDKGKAERHEPSGFGTSILAVMTSKPRRGKQINAIYDWSTFVDVSVE
ncbi:MAG: AAA family ATPase [Armatimonadota bacterium]